MADARFYRNPFAPDARDRYRRGDLVAEWTYPDCSKAVLFTDGSPVPWGLLPRCVTEKAARVILDGLGDGAHL